MLSVTMDKNYDHRPKFRQPRKEIAPQRVSKEQEGFDSGEFVEGIKAVMVEQMETPEERKDGQFSSGKCQE